MNWQVKLLHLVLTQCIWESHGELIQLSFAQRPSNDNAREVQLTAYHKLSHFERGFLLEKLHNCKRRLYFLSNPFGSHNTALLFELAVWISRFTHDYMFVH
ncbi:hypothetical protein TNCT_603341 [Trichonephila clavata]|uniref:Secreted protein n=1 Tax=Trichonephila clavata TaxID=2740835 RepID=A0A8X6J843_TRICU|nr:hypothetical protein TNCT_603341 [Trichonephila clavata]